MRPWLVCLVLTAVYGEAAGRESLGGASGSPTSYLAGESAGCEQGEMPLSAIDMSLFDWEEAKMVSETGRQLKGDYEEKFSDFDIACASMLIGALLFLMGLFYMVNHPDPDFKYYVWWVLSYTIGIFTAVLLFSTFKRQVKYQRLLGVEEWEKVVMSYAMMLVGLVILYVVIIGIIDKREHSVAGIFVRARDASGLSTLMPSAGPSAAKRRLTLTGWVTILAHFVGFASINAGGNVQQLACFRGHPFTALIVAPAHTLLVLGIFMLMERFRARRVSRDEEEGKGLSHDDLHLWRHSVEEAENDVMCLTLSFLTVQAVRFFICGVLPNGKGKIKVKYKPIQGSLGLAISGLCFAALVVADVQLMRRHREFLRRRPLLNRLLVIAQDSASMGFSWCIIFATKWEFARQMPHTDPGYIHWRIIMALLLSAIAFSCIFLLGRVAEPVRTKESGDEAVVSIKKSLGLLVGFSWEKGFEGSINILASLLPLPNFSDVALVGLVTMIVVPAWQWFIIKKVLQAEAQMIEAAAVAAEEEEEEPESADSSAESSAAGE